MMTAVGHLETHGYVAVLRSSAGEQHILLAPDLLVNLAASIMLQADKNPRELGAVSETELLQGKYPSMNSKGWTSTKRRSCSTPPSCAFCSTTFVSGRPWAATPCSFSPGLIKQKRPLQDDLPATDDTSYVVRGRVENLYASLVVLLGYTPSFTRINQWQNQAQYEMEPGAGLRLPPDRRA